MHRLDLSASARRGLLYALFVVAGVAQGAIVPLLPRFSERFGLSGAQTALLLALPGLATLAVSVPSGLAADRLGARRVTLAAGALLCISCVAQATPSLPALLAGRLVFGIAFGVVWTAGLAWLAELDAEAGRGSCLGAAVTYSSVGVMLGPAIAGAMAQHAGLAAPFIAIAIASALVALPLVAGRASVVEPAGAGVAGAAAARIAGVAAAAGAPGVAGAAGAAGASVTGAAGGRGAGGAGAVGVEADPAPSRPTRRELVALMRRPRVGAAAGALIVSGAVSSAGQLLISADLHHAGLSTSRIGLAFSAAAVCYILVSALIVRLRRRAQTLRFNAIATVALALALAPAVGSGGVIALVLALMLSSAPRAAIGTIGYALAAGERAGDGGAGRADGFVFGMLNGAWAAATVLMPVIAGVVQQGAGARAAYLAVIIPSCGIAAWLVAGAAGGGGGRHLRLRRPAFGAHRL